MILLPLVYLLVSNDDPWLPAETIETSIGPEIGYVLKADSAEFILMRHSNREIRIIDPALVRERTICRFGGGGWFDSIFEKRVFDYLGTRDEARPRYQGCVVP